MDVPHQPEDWVLTPTLRRNAAGPTALALVAGAPMCVSKCRCGPDEWPEVPTTPIG
jgi:hypothetical protein